MSIQATNYEVEDMGRYFKSSKKKYKWTFLLDDKQHVLELEFSYFSGKRRLVLDGRVLHESMMLTSSFQYPFTLEGFALNVIQQGDAFELRINNKVFSHLYTHEKNRSEFTYENPKPDNFYPTYDQPVASNSYGNFNQPQQKLNLNLKIEGPKEGTSSTYNSKISNNTYQAKPLVFGQPNAFEDFDQYGGFSQKGIQDNTNPFGNAFQIEGYSASTTQPGSNSQKTINLLDDDPAPAPQQIQSLVTQIQPPVMQNQQPVQTQGNPFDAFGGGWANQPAQVPAQQPVQQPFVQNSMPFQQTTPQQSLQFQPQPNDPFGAFSNVQQQPLSSAQQPQLSQTQPQPQPQPQQQQTLNLLNLYGGQQQNMAHMAYNAFPQVPTQPIMYNQFQPPQQQAQPTPFDLFK